METNWKTRRRKEEKSKRTSKQEMSKNQWKTDVNIITSTGGASPWTWRNKTHFGKQHVTWKVEGVKYFRYSFTKKFIFGFYINFMLGTGGSGNRQVIKLRFFKVK